MFFHRTQKEKFRKRFMQPFFHTMHVNGNGPPKWQKRHHKNTLNVAYTNNALLSKSAKAIQKLCVRNRLKRKLFAENPPFLHLTGVIKNIDFFQYDLSIWKGFNTHFPQHQCTGTSHWYSLSLLSDFCGHDYSISYFHHADLQWEVFVNHLRLWSKIIYVFNINIFSFPMKLKVVLNVNIFQGIVSKFATTLHLTIKFRSVPHVKLS